MVLNFRLWNLLLGSFGVSTAMMLSIRIVCHHQIMMNCMQCKIFYINILKISQKSTDRLERGTILFHPKRTVIMVGQPAWRIPLRNKGLGFGLIKGNQMILISPDHNWLVVEPTHLKNMLVKNGFIFPKFRGENQTYLSCLEKSPNFLVGDTLGGVFGPLAPHLHAFLVAQHSGKHSWADNHPTYRGMKRHQTLQHMIDPHMDGTPKMVGENPPNHPF